jgi:UDP-galactopyranose mutase
MESRYFSDKFQAIPKNGYTAFFESLVDHPNITVKLNTDLELPINHKCVIYTGPIDKYFKSSGLAPLQYRSLRFEEEIFLNTGYIKQNILTTYPSQDIPYTRVTEYKHLPYPEHVDNPHSILVKEYPADNGEPYYPVPTKENQELYERYKELAENSGVHMLGRLANYKYFNMDQAIRNALDYYSTVRDYV